MKPTMDQSTVPQGRAARVGFVYEACCLRCGERSHVIAGGMLECEKKLRPRGWKKSSGFWLCPVCCGGKVDAGAMKLCGEASDG